MRILYLAKQVAGEDEGCEAFVGGGHDLILVANPFQLSLVYIYNMFAYSHDGVHVVGVDDGGHVVFLGDAVDKFVYDQRGLGVEARVWLVAEKVLGVQRYGTCYGHAFLHASGDFAGELLFCSL